MTLTDEIVRDFLQYLYDNDYRYLYIGTCTNLPLVSKSKPLFSKDINVESMMIYDKLSGYASKLGKAILDNEGHCIDIGKKLNIIDWSAVKVDTKIRVRDYEEDPWTNRYFACYEKGKVYAYDGGATSWSVKPYKCSDLVPWNFAEVVDE